MKHFWFVTIKYINTESAILFSFKKYVEDRKIKLFKNCKDSSWFLKISCFQSALYKIQFSFILQFP
jgi:hypothetical protein